MISAFKGSSAKRIEALKEKKDSEDAEKKRKRELNEEATLLNIKKSKH